MASGVVGNRADAVAVNSIDAIIKRLRSGQVKLPPNHHLQRASTESLRQASQFMLCHVQQTLSPELRGWNNWRRRFQRSSSASEQWCRSFERLLRNAEAFERFDHAVILDQQRLTMLVDNAAPDAVAGFFHDRYAAWLKEQELAGLRPELIDACIQSGWQVDGDSDIGRITLYQAYCLFFQDKLKTSVDVRTIFDATNDAQLAHLVRNLHSQNSELSDQLSNEIGPLGEAMRSLLQQLKTVHKNQDELAQSLAFEQESIGRYLSGMHDGIAQLQRGMSHLLERQRREEAVAADLQNFAVREARRHGVMRMPLMDQKRPNGKSEPVPLPSELLRVDLPLRLTYEHQVDNHEDLLCSVEHWEQCLREGFTSALLVDRAARIPAVLDRTCRLSERLDKHPRIVIVGDPGCGKSTLLLSVAHRYAIRWLPPELQAKVSVPLAERASQDSLPNCDWLPVVLTCRDLLGVDPNAGLAALIAKQLATTGAYTLGQIDSLADELATQLLSGRGILIVDGLDEIPQPEHRRRFAQWLANLAREHEDLPLLLSSRVAGFQAIREILSESFDHVNVAPLDAADKAAFVNAWAKLVERSQLAPSAGDLIRDLLPQVCHRSQIAKICENIFILSLIAQMHLRDNRQLQKARPDIYLRFVQLMLAKQTADVDALSLNEVWPRLERLAYEMRCDGAQRWPEARVVQCLRTFVLDEEVQGVVGSRAAQEWLQAVIDRLGILNVAGREMDEQYVEHRMIQFFHQSFQEYFAGQALRHGRTGHESQDLLAQLREKVHDIEIRDRLVESLGNGTRSEPVVAGQWQEVVRHCIESLGQSGERSASQTLTADDALLMILPAASTDLREARALAVFAMQCLANTSTVRSETAIAVFDAAIDALGRLDGCNLKQNTFMDEAMHVVANSDWGDMLKARLLSRYLQARGQSQRRIGSTMVSLLHLAANSEEAVPGLLLELQSDDVHERVVAALSLLEIFYRGSVQGKSGYALASEEQQRAVVEQLLACGLRRDPSAAAALWALTWVTGARRDVMYAPAYVISQAHRELLREILTDSTRDDMERMDAATLLGFDRESPSVNAIVDWIYSWAVVADGGKTQREMPQPPAPVREVDILLIESALAEVREPFAQKSMAVALGRLGCFRPEMFALLQAIFEDDMYSSEERDEALVYLSHIADPRRGELLRQHARLYPQEDDSKDKYGISSRALLSIVGCGDVESILSLLPWDKNLPAYNYAYVRGLTGLADDRGIPILELWANHPHEKLRKEANRALMFLAAQRLPGLEYPLHDKAKAVNLYESADWIYEWALVSDGDKPHRELPSLPPPPALDVTALQAALAQCDDAKVRQRMAIVLGRNGCFLPEMVGPLATLFEDDSREQEERREAVFYLAQIDDPARDDLLVKHASRFPLPTEGKEIGIDSYALLAIVGTGSLPLILRMLPLVEHIPWYDGSYVRVLAGLADDRGLSALQTLTTHPDPRVSATAVATLQKRSSENGAAN